MKKDLDDVKRHLHSIESNTSYMLMEIFSETLILCLTFILYIVRLNTATKNRNNVDRHKYEKLKLRLTMIESKIKSSINWN